MPVYRCNQCGLIAEDFTTPVGTRVACGRCGTPSMVYGTVFYLEKLIERHVATLRELKALQQAENETEGASAPEEAPAAEAPATPSGAALGEDLSNTTLLATAEQHAPLARWFEERRIVARFDHQRVDTSGFFDEAARMIGERHDLFAELVERVRFGYRRSLGSIGVDLSNLGQKDAQAINQLCRQLYSHTFFSRYYYQKPEKLLRLTLQTAPAVRQFFEGEWLEWFVFAESLEALRARGRGFSVARGVRLEFANEDLHELDVVVLPEGQPPICIECKSGEFRRDIDKHLRLRKRLGIDRARYILCASDLDDEQSAGLSAMYELSFGGLAALPRLLQNLLKA